MARPFKEIDPEVLEQLTEQYSDVEIGAMLGHARVTVTLCRQRLGIKSFTEKKGMKRDIKNGTGVTHGGRKRLFLFNENFFSKLETEAQAYFLGFITADGCVHSNKGKIEISLSECDVAILYKFKEALGGKTPELGYRPYTVRQNVYRLTLCSKTMASDLISWGITPNKTHTLKIVRPIPDNLLRHFLRGFWDGDGHIRDKCFEILIASETFADQVQDFAVKLTGQPLNKRYAKVRSNHYAVLTGYKNRKAFIQALYSDSTIYLERKFVQFSRFWSS